MPPTTIHRPEMPEKTIKRPGAVAAGGASLLIPGGGQFWQRRYTTGAVHLITFAAYALTASRFGGGWWAAGALLVNAWSSIEAGWWARGSGEDPDPTPSDSTESAESVSPD